MPPELNQSFYNCHHSLLWVWVLVWASKSIHSEEGQPGGLGAVVFSRFWLIGPPIAEKSQDLREKHWWGWVQRQPLIQPHLPPPYAPCPQLGLTISRPSQQFQVGILAFPSCASFQPHGLVLWSTACLATSNMVLLQAVLLGRSLSSLGPRGHTGGEPQFSGSEQTNCLLLFHPNWGKDGFPDTTAHHMSLRDVWFKEHSCWHLLHGRRAVCTSSSYSYSPPSSQWHLTCKTADSDTFYITHVHPHTSPCPSLNFLHFQFLQ